MQPRGCIYFSKHMRAIWSGTLSFGLVTIPIRLYSALQPKELSFHLLHKKDLSPIRFAKVCRAEGSEVAYEDIVKGYEYHDGDYVVMTDEDFKKANVTENSTIEIIQFTDEKEIDPIFFEKPYYLEPDRKTQKPYTLLLDALKKSKKVGVAKYVLRSKEHLGIIRPHGDLIVLEQMHFAEEIRKPEGLQTAAKSASQKKEIDLALQLIDQLSTSFKPDNYSDTYTDQLKKIIEAKAKGRTPKAHGTAPEPIHVRDLMATLRRSLEAEQGKKTKSSKKHHKTR